MDKTPSLPLVTGTLVAVKQPRTFAAVAQPSLVRQRKHNPVVGGAVQPIV